MSFLDILRKLGIFRSGTVVQKYHNNEERSVVFIQDNVFDEKKDLILNKNLSDKIKKNHIKNKIEK